MRDPSAASDADVDGEACSVAERTDGLEKTARRTECADSKSSVSE